MLRDTGEAVDDDYRTMAPPSAGIMLLSRSLCRFAFLNRSPSLALKEEESAALLHAEAHAPFSRSDWVVLRSPDGFGIWWWDADRVEGLLGGRTAYHRDRFVPESLGYASATGWRQLRTADGYEAQYVEGTALRASSWRRGPFDIDQWRGFADAVTLPSVPAPREPPSPVSPGWPEGQPWFNRLVVRKPLWSRVERAGWIAAAACVAIAAVLVGHAARYGAIAEAHRAAIVEMKSDRAATRIEARTAADIALAAAGGSVAPLPEHLIAVADVIAAMEGAGIEPAEWSSNREELSVSGVGSGPIEDLASRLGQNPRLRDVEPFRSGENTIIRARIVASRVALSDGAP